MEKILFFAKLLSQEIRKADDALWDTVYRLLSVDDDIDIFTGTTLRLPENKYVFLEKLYEDMQVEDLLLEVKEDEADEDDEGLAEYATDFDKGELEKLVGILFPNDFLYEILYDFGMLGDKFGDEEKDRAVEELLSAVYKISGAFNLDLHFLDGRIYITSDKKPLDDGSFICETMAEVEVVCKLQKGASLIEAREASGMSEKEFDDFRERLKQQEWKQTSAWEG